MDGEFVKVGEDLAIMFSLLEMAGDKVEYVPAITYQYSDETGLNDGSKPLAAKNWKDIETYYRNRPKLPVFTKEIKFRTQKRKQKRDYLK